MYKAEKKNRVLRIPDEKFDEYCRVELWDQKMSASAPVENTFAARKFLVSAELSGVSGEKKQSMSGNLNAIGDPVDGYFNTKTQTFEEATA